jgi:cyclophilin family peptidyl-prolyl cis-trans isomerase
MGQLLNFSTLSFVAAALLIWPLHHSDAFADSSPSFQLPKAPDLKKLKSGVMRTSKGDIYFELFPEDAPWHVANFKYLADKKFYDNTVFHSHKEGFILQAGLSANSNKGPGYSLPPEFNYRKHVPGTLGMARAIDIVNPQRRSHGSQFHLLLTENTRMDGSYTIFGQVVRGMDVLKSLTKGDTIRSLTVYVRDSKAP